VSKDLFLIKTPYFLFIKHLIFQMFLCEINAAKQAGQGAASESLFSVGRRSSKNFTVLTTITEYLLTK